MKRFLIIFSFLFLLVSYGNTQRKMDNIELSQLLQIVEQSDFFLFRSVVFKLGYFFTDSSKNIEGRMTYELKQDGINGDKLWVVEYNNKLEGMTFFTFSKKLSDKFKKQLKQKKFVAGEKKGTKEEFKRNTILVLTDAGSNEGEAKVYEFSFIDSGI
ncbi:MAG: hypothetical protein WDN26_09810 [Chitinophagaceae bacterium]